MQTKRDTSHHKKTLIMAVATTQYYPSKEGRLQVSFILGGDFRLAPLNHALRSIDL
jgi:hypothetical protein